MSVAEELLAHHLRIVGLGGFEREVRFHPTRKWRFDFAWPEAKVAVEVEGGSWIGGRHVRPKGFAADAEKYAEATILGWAVVRVTPEMVRDGRALGLIERTLQLRGVGA